MKNSTILFISITSDIGIALANRYAKNGYNVIGTYRSKKNLNKLTGIPADHLLPCDINSSQSTLKFVEKFAKLNLKWDILIFCPATLKPIGPFFTCNFNDWNRSLHINAIEQLRILHELYPFRNQSPLATVILFAGSGTNSASPNFSAYTLSKIMLIKMCELIDAENPNLKITAVGPGWVKTKIHNEAIETGEERVGSNYKKTKEFMASGQGTSMEEIYDCINWLTKQDKKVVSGRNFSLVNDPWRNKGDLVSQLLGDKDMYKLRRHKNNLYAELKK